MRDNLKCIYTCIAIPGLHLAAQLW